VVIVNSLRPVVIELDKPELPARAVFDQKLKHNGHPQDHLQALLLARAPLNPKDRTGASSAYPGRIASNSGWNCWSVEYFAESCFPVGKYPFDIAPDE